MPAWTPVAGGLVVAGVSVVLAALATPAQLDSLHVVCEEDICDTLARPTPDLLDQVAAIGVTPQGWAILVVVVQWVLLLSFCALGILMMRRRPSLLAVVSGLGLMVVALQDFLPAFDAHGLARAVLVLVAGVNQTCLFLILALFPDGRWYPRFLRVVAVPGVIAISANSVCRAAGVVVPAVDQLESAVILALVLAQADRYFRRSDWVARQQAKWVLVGFCMLVTILLLSQVLGARGLISQFQLAMVIGVYGAFFTLGLGFTFAVLRYRLYDVGVVLWRTFTYGAGLVAVLAGYFALVALAGMSMATQTASVLGIAVVAVAVVGGGWLAGRLRRRLRDRLYGTGNVAATLASSIASPDGGGSGLAGTIARTLALPHVVVRDVDGEVVSTFGLAPASGSVRQPVVDGSGGVLGTLLLAPAYGDELDSRDRRALAEVLPFVVLVLRAQRETQELRQARIAAAGSREDERRRLRRDLHDGVGPLLASQLVTLDTIKVAREKGVPADALYDSLEEQTRAAIGEIRWITRDLRPPVLDAGGLPAALKAEEDRVAATGLSVVGTVDLGEEPLPAVVEVNVLRIVQEALANVVRHAHASVVELTVTLTPGAVDVTITDDGRGRGEAPPGVGTSSMRERAEELGGTITIDTGPDGTGTRVHGSIPL